MKKKKGKQSELLLAQVNHFCFIKNLQFFLCLHCPLKVSIATYNGLNAFKQWPLNRTRVKKKKKQTEINHEPCRPGGSYLEV